MSALIQGRTLRILGFALSLVTLAPPGAAWAPVEGRIMTPWAAGVTPDNAWREYPRPQMVREDWQCLNGLWDFVILGEEREWTSGRIENALFDPLLSGVPNAPAKWDTQILVPYCPESALSGVGKLVRPNQLLWYRRGFTIPAGWQGQRVLLHFEAVDWHAIVLVNGQRVGEHKGGYVPFSFDITDALAQGENELRVVVWDPTNMGDQAIGKQALPELKRGFRYTPASGIWQTVWLEPVPRESIGALHIDPDVASGSVSVTSQITGNAAGLETVVRVLDGEIAVSEAVGAAGAPCVAGFTAAKLWSPERPFLYGLEVVLRRNGGDLDRVRSYFGMRDIRIAAGPEGNERVLLNGEPIFQFGPLDQGYWPDGILTPPSDAAAKFDVQYLKDIGCNMVRVHIKVHPARWYYYCDQMGLLVWQDFVCTRKFDQHITEASAAQWELEQQRMMDHLRNHPAIIKWIVFNEGWGQYDTERLTRWAKAYDSARLVSCASGWTDADAGDIYDIHDYSYHISPAWGDAVPDRASLCGECAGFSVLLKGHLWHADQEPQVSIFPDSEKGREAYPDAATWASRYAPWIDELRVLKSYGMNAAVFTQISDVEHECNGWLTYGRKVSKIPVEQLRAWHLSLYEAPPALTELAGRGAGAVKFRSAKTSGTQWTAADFKDAAWTAAAASPAFPLAPLAKGEGHALMVRVPFVLKSLPARPVLRYIGTGNLQVYLNGELVQTVSNSDRAGYLPVSMVILPPKALELLRTGENLLAVRQAPVPANKAGYVTTSQARLWDAALLDWAK